MININKPIDKINDRPFLNCAVSYIKKLIKRIILNLIIWKIIYHIPMVKHIFEQEN